MEGPQPGDPGLAVIAAHRDSHFRFLKDIRIGDRISVTRRDGATIVFAISETRIVDANHSGLSFGADRPMLALVTCFPFDALKHGPKRFVAIGEVVETDR
jgi:sortase A